MRLHIFQHTPTEGPGEIAHWARRQGHELSISHLYLSDSPAPPESFDALAIMGGPMNVYEYRNHPWLRAEKRAIERAIAAGRTDLGICLGAQLIADVLGAKVYQNP